MSLFMRLLLSPVTVMYKYSINFIDSNTVNIPLAAAMFMLSLLPPTFLF